MAAKARSQTQDLGTLDPRDVGEFWTVKLAHDPVAGFNKKYDPCNSDVKIGGGLSDEMHHGIPCEELDVRNSRYVIWILQSSNTWSSYV
ncbi:hypothetical protein G6011_09946 [Alternaria panax]|uniref:Uncharacterized protein n=1 Tax=Alternaria panax TaxID=48097 RepID=A0AAD4I5V3_9PLEO|nr:hypothetical protein G6011_09946 [Alternaria panax]